jgi:hypothetical protein
MNSAPKKLIPPSPKGSQSLEIKSFVDRGGTRPPVLSLIHTTDFCRLIDIQNNDVLATKADKRFPNENLLYFFYGRPSYRVNPSVRETRVSSFAPICFVFRREFDWQGKRLHLFDTGAFIDGRMMASIHPSFTLEDFQLPPVTSSAQDLVKAFYGSNRNYLDCAPSNEVDIDDVIKRRLLRVETYYNLIRFAPNDNSDERVHSIEVQVDSDVLLKGNLLAVVIPGRFFDTEQVVALRKTWECEIVQYHLKAVFTPNDFMSLLFEKVREVLLSDGQIS